MEITALTHYIIGFASLLTAGGIIVKYALKGVEKMLNPVFRRIDDLELQTDKNFLIRFLADIEQDAKIDEIEWEHFWKTYEQYHKLGGNSYIDHKVEKLKKEGKI